MAYHPSCYNAIYKTNFSGRPAKYKTRCDAGKGCLKGGHIDPINGDYYYYETNRRAPTKKMNFGEAMANVKVEPVKVIKQVKCLKNEGMANLTPGETYDVLEADQYENGLYRIRRDGGTSQWVSKYLFTDIQPGFPKQVICISGREGLITEGKTYTAVSEFDSVYRIQSEGGNTVSALKSLFQDWHPYKVEVIDTNNGLFHIGAIYEVAGETRAEYLLVGTGRSFPWYLKGYFKKVEPIGEEQIKYVRCVDPSTNSDDNFSLHKGQVYTVDTAYAAGNTYKVQYFGLPEIFNKDRFVDVADNETILKCIRAENTDDLIQDALYIRDDIRSKHEGVNVYLLDIAFPYLSERFEVVDRKSKTLKEALQEAADKAKAEIEKAEAGSKLVTVDAKKAAEQLKPILQKMVNDAVAAGIDKDKMADDIALKVLDKVQSVIVTTVEIKLPDGSTQNVGVQHKQFPILLKSVAARINVWLAGPSASGKTTAAEQVAKALKLPFRFTGAVGDAYALLGYNDAQGRYVRTQFREAFEHGGLFLWDEVDASDPNALLAFNAALANDLAPFPDGIVKKHPDCVMIAAANTFGHGATHEYVGRLKMDAAFLKRFAFLSWDYDENLEMETAPNKVWTKRVQEVRRMVKASGLRVLVTPRESYIGARLLAAGIPQHEVEQMTIKSGCTDEQWKQINNPTARDMKFPSQRF